MKNLSITLAAALQFHENTGYPLFFCNERKAPACPGGFHSAASSPDKIHELWRNHPGPLVAFPTGETTGVSVLDVDSAKHPEAAAWWAEHGAELEATTSVYASRSCGKHVYFRHSPGLKSSVKLHGIVGLDIRGDNGYVIAWHLTGAKTLAERPLALWPDEMLPKATLRHERRPAPPRLPDDASVGRLLRWAVAASQSERNQRLFWTGCRLAEQVQHGTMSARYAEALLEHAGLEAGLPIFEARRTAQSALKGIL